MDDDNIEKLISNQFYDIMRKWRVFIYIYGYNQERVDIMFNASPLIYDLLYTLLWESVLVGIRRLTDPAKTRGKNQNLSLERLVKIAEENGHVGFGERFSKIKKLAENTNKLVDKTIAHYDYKLEKERGSKRFHITRRDTTDVIEEIRSFLIEYYLQIRKTTLILKPILHTKDEAHFLKVLYSGNQKYDELIEDYKKRVLEVKPDERFPSLEESIPYYIRGRGLEDYNFRIDANSAASQSDEST